MIQGTEFRNTYRFENAESLYILQTGIYGRSFEQYLSSKLQYHQHGFSLRRMQVPHRYRLAYKDYTFVNYETCCRVSVIYDHQ